MMAWKTVRGNYSDTEHVKFRTLPEVTVASCTYQGSYTQITDVYAAVIAWMDANGCEPAGPSLILIGASNNKELGGQSNGF